MAYGSKVLWLDTETTGLDAVKNDVIQMAAIIEIDGQVDCSFEFTCQPHNYDNVDQRALDVHGMQMNQLMSFEAPYKVKQQVEGVFKRYIDKFDKNDKFILAGYNVDFDARFMRQWWSKCGDKWWGSYVDYKSFDIYPMFFNYARMAKLSLENHKLVTAAAHFGISFGEEGAHDAMADIRVTREVGNELGEIMLAGIKARG